jgi:peptidyl-prolyl cis-trans isomerase B (cyclophilin B)
VASSRDRQRKLARAKLDRQLARRAGRERKQRRVLAGVGAVVAVLLIVGGVAWVGGAFDKDPSTDTASGDVCAWTPQSKDSNASLQEVGTPPTKDIATSGTAAMTVTTNHGAPIVVGLDRTTSPCAVASLSYLAGKKFYDNTQCHEITTYGAVHCGDPSGTGDGGPTYSFYGENVPLAPDPSASASPQTKAPLYPKGTVALIGNPPGANSSQFLIFFKDYSPPNPEFTIVGKVTAGLDTVTALGKIPTVADKAGDKVTPKEKIVISSLTVGATPTAAPSASNQS